MRFGSTVALALALPSCFSAIARADVQAHTWTRIGLAGENLWGMNVAPHFMSGDPVIIAANKFDGEVHRSSDGGATWQSGFPRGTGSRNIAKVLFSPTFHSNS